MLPLISTILILIITTFNVFYIYLKRAYLTNMTGMIASMTNAMMTSIAIGNLLGAFLKDKDLSIPTIIAVSVGIIVGYSTGRPLSLIAALEGVTAGIMGGMMGAMLGVMVPLNTTGLMVCFIDILYLFVNAILFQVIDSETVSVNKPTKNDFSFANLFVMIGILMILSFLVYLNFHMLFIN